ncbi:MAG TPA: acetate/propionate family kinase [Acidimicrobiales bacterium]|nr:acetate/propionate family kinase [Acidimicrobiales bacterium]
MTAAVLVVNVGSTSLKLALFNADASAELWARETALAADSDRVAAIGEAIGESPAHEYDVVAVGHRIVHGGATLTAPVVVNAGVEAAIEAAAQYAPLHNRAGLDGIHAACGAVAGAPQVAVFDTAFHHTLPDAAAVYGGPYDWFATGLRRYGFHGISHEHAARTAAALLARPVDELCLVTCHLGGGSSVTAVERGRSVDTTMGLTPLDGLIMTTRSGSVDPALVLHLLRAGATVDEVENVLEHRSGLAGLSGTSGDLRDVVAARDVGSARAALAIDAFVHRVASGVGAMAAALGRLDAIVFTGGIGVHSAEVRARVCDQFAFAGLGLDAARNTAATGDTVISHADSPLAAAVVTAREEEAIARACAALVGHP